MRVLQISATYYPELKFGGPPQKIHALSQGLVRHGYDVQVITIHSNSRKARKDEIIDGIDVHYSSWFGSGSWQLPLSWNKLLRDIKRADIIHCYGLYNLLCPAAAFLSKQAARPYILEPLGMYVPRTGNLRAKFLYHQLFTSRMFKEAAAVIATSSAEAKELSGLVDDEKLILRRNGIDLELFNRLPSGANFRAAHDIGNDERVVLYIGRISPIKNLEQLVLAFRDAALERARLMLIGPMLEPEYAARLRSMIAELDLTSRVQLTGALYDQEKLAALSAADLFILPSLYESYGNAAAEAVAARVPALLTESCGIAPIIHERAGLAVPQSVEGLANGLRIMLDDAGQRARLTSQQSEVRSELSWEEPLEQTIKLYERLVLRSKPASQCVATLK